MPDVLTPEQRRHNMARVRSRDTKPELMARRKLHHGGFRYRLHVADLPGTPDIVLPRHRTVVFVHGCFWHGHNCSAGRLPTSRIDFWASKISSNCTRDATAKAALEASGWRVFTVWGCALRGRARQPPGALLKQFASWLASPKLSGELAERALEQENKMRTGGYP